MTVALARLGAASFLAPRPRDALGAVLTSPARLAPALPWPAAVSVAGAAACTADWCRTENALPPFLTQALIGLAAGPMLAAQKFQTVMALGTIVAWPAATLTRFAAESLLGVAVCRTNWYVTKTSLPARLALNLAIGSACEAGMLGHSLVQTDLGKGAGWACVVFCTT